MTAKGLSELSEVSQDVPVRAQRAAVKFITWLAANGVNRDEAAKNVMQFMVEVLPKRKAVKASPAQTMIVQTLVRRYVALYRDVYGEELKSPPGMEIGHLSRLAKDYSVEVISSRLQALARYVKADPFMARLGFKPSTLVNQWIRVTAYAKQNEPRAKQTAPSDCRHQPQCRDAMEHTQRILKDARR